MRLIDAIQNDKGSIVIVDDDFSPPNFDEIGADALTAQFNLICSDASAKQSLMKLMGQSDEASPGNLAKLAQQRAGEYWTDYLANPQKYPFLHPLLSDFRSGYLASRARIISLVAFLKKHFGIEPLTFASMEEARAHIETCMLAFVDFFINVDNEDDAINLHSQFRNELSAPFKYQEIDWPKLVFLISSKLPQQEGLHKFRSATGIKSAFFLAFDKGQITDAFLTRLVDRCIERYGPSTELNSYLMSIEVAINNAAESLLADVSRLELHDLTALKTLRLDAESESLQSYLTWLLAEALAVKLRGAHSLRNPLLPKEASFVPLDGQLLPRSVLFELFSEIAVGPSTGDQNARLVFGDVLANVATDEHGKALLLVIAPACDLMRCSDAYEVLCVHGKLEAEGASLAELLNKNYKFGKGHLVLRTAADNGAHHYSIVRWNDKEICTVPYASLSKAKAFPRIARLSEIFSQEVKEMVLSQLARIGTPVDPSFSVALHCLVRLKLSMGKGEGPLVMLEDLSDRDFVCAISAMGREEDSEDQTKTIIFSHQFQDWLVSGFLLEAIQKAGDYGAKLTAAKEFFGNATNLTIPLAKTVVRPCGDFVSVTCADEPPADEQTGQGLQIILFPYQG